MCDEVPIHMMQVKTKKGWRKSDFVNFQTKIELLSRKSQRGTSFWIQAAFGRL